MKETTETQNDITEVKKKFKPRGGYKEDEIENSLNVTLTPGSLFDIFTAFTTLMSWKKICWNAWIAQKKM